MTYDLIMNDIKNAMLDKNNVKRDCLRSVISEIKNRTINAGKSLSEDICIDVLKKAVKQRNDSIESFKRGKREDLALKELEELKYIECYLPKMLSEEQMQIEVLKLIATNKIPEVKKSLGQIMKCINMLPNKDQFDKKYVSTYLNSILK